MKIGFLFLILTLAISSGVEAVEMAVETNTGVAPQDSKRVINAGQPAYYENGRPVYINIKPRKKKCKVDEIYDKQAKECKKPIKTKD